MVENQEEKEVDKEALVEVEKVVDSEVEKGVGEEVVLEFVKELE